MSRAAWALAPGLALLLAAVSVDGGSRSDVVERGRAVFMEQGCYGCHTVGGFGTPIATDLSHLGGRYSEAELVRWLRDPSAQAPAHMPKIEMTAADIHAVAAWLASLR